VLLDIVLLDDEVRPHKIQQLSLGDKLARPFGQRAQQIEAARPDPCRRASTSTRHSCGCSSKRVAKRRLAAGEVMAKVCARTHNNHTRQTACRFIGPL
jgi:hypothetical protein